VSDWSLLLAFDSDHPEFVRGFEAARLWEHARADHAPWERTVHATNTEMVMRIAEATGREFRAELDGEWLHVRFL
jgi:hypothetical protein